MLYGWRATTIDIDMRMTPERDAIERAIPQLKERLNVNVEFASPADFIPVKAGWEDRSPYAMHSGHVTAYHFDLYAQALAKLERGHQRDLTDVRAMVERNLVDLAQILPAFDAIAPALYKFPAIDPTQFRKDVVDFVETQRQRSLNEPAI